MSTPYYRNQQYIFSASAENVDAECNENILQMENNVRTSEYMYSCLATRADNPTPVKIYISRGYSDYEVYTFQVIGDNVMENGEHVGVVKLDENFKEVFFVKMETKLKRELGLYGGGGDHVSGSSYSATHVSNSDDYADIGGMYLAASYAADAFGEGGGGDGKK